MRILQVIEFFSPKMGGSAQVAYQTARHLARRGHEVVVWSSDYGSREAAFPEDDFEVKLFDCTAARSGFYLTPSIIPYARQHLADFDIVHLHNVRTFQNIVVGRLARRFGLPYVFSAHGSLPRLVERKAAKQAFDQLFGKRLLRGARQMIAVSTVEAKQFVQAGIPQEKIALVPNGIDLEEFAHLPPPGAFRRQLGISEKTFLVLFLGRIHRIKGVEHLIAAFDLASKQIKDACLVIAGPDDGDLTRLQTMAKDLKLDRQIIFPGPLYGRDKLAAFVDATVLVSPAGYEIFGLVPFEALMCGTPVIVAQESASGKLIAEIDAGYIVPFGDQKSLEKTLISIQADGSQSRPGIVAGQTFVREKLAWDYIAADLEGVYVAETAANPQHAFASGYFSG